MHIQQCLLFSFQNHIIALWKVLVGVCVDVLYVVKKLDHKSSELQLHLSVSYWTYCSVFESCNQLHFIITGEGYISQPFRQIGEMKAQVMAISSCPKTIQRRGVESEVLSIFIADETAQIRLQLWDSQISAVKTQASYAFTNLSVREYGGEKFLTTTKNSTIAEIDPVTITDVTVPSLILEENNFLQTIESEVVAVKLANNFNCRSCYKRQSAFFNPKGEAEGCQLVRITSLFLATTSGVLHVVIDGV